jgi:type VI secretion system protein VasD
MRDSSSRPGAGLVLRLLASGVMAFAASRCGGSPPPPTVVELTLSATGDANSTLSGQGAPVAVRVYQLSSTAAFDQAEFFQLYRQDTTTLGSDTVKRDEYRLKPDSNQSVSLRLTDQVRALGVFAAYRDFQDKNWRSSAEVPAHKTTALKATVSASGVTLAPSSSPAAGGR